MSYKNTAAIPIDPADLDDLLSVIPQLIQEDHAGPAFYLMPPPPEVPRKPKRRRV